MAQILLELHHSMLFSNIFILKELIVLSLCNFTLNRVVWKCDQKAIKELVINFIRGSEDFDGISKDEADEEAEHRCT